MKLLLCLPVLFSFPHAHAAEPTVTLAGIQVVMDDGEKEFDGFKTFNMNQGHNVALIVRSKGKAIVSYDEDKASITLGGAKTQSNFFSNMAFSKDRQALKLEFRTSDPVQPDARGQLKVTGELPITLASGKAESRSSTFEVKDGTSITFPEGTTNLPKLKIKSIGKPNFGDAEMEIQFTTNRRIDEFAGVRFYTKDGKPFEADQAGSSWMGFGTRGSGEVSYRFKSKQTELILAVETWTDTEEITLKVDLPAGLAPPKP